MKYADKLKDPRWQKKRLQVLERDGWSCQNCGDNTSTLHVHHRRYIHGRDPWDYDDGLLLTVCAECHEEEKDARPSHESDLIEMLREKFWHDDIYELAQGFHLLKMQHIPGVIASTIKATLSDDELMRELIERYFKSLKA